MNWLRRHGWLLFGAALIVAANLRWGVGVLAWIAPVPLLRYLRFAPGVRPRLALAAMLPVAWTLATLKIMTDPLPAIAAVAFGVGYGLVFLVGYLAWDALRRRADDWRAVLAFPAIMIGAEWTQARFTGLASWGAAAYTQLDNLPLLQVASVFGVFGVSAVVYGVAAALERAWATSGTARLRWAGAAAALVVVAHGFGAARLAAPTSVEREVRAAAVGTDATFSGVPLPSADDVARIDDALFARTRRAAEAGASLVVWNEGATVVMPDREPAFLARAAAAARDARVELVVSYVSPVSMSPLLYENQYRWIRPDGTVDHRYLKHEPVPGEPAVRGTEDHRAVETGFGRASGAICYDYDFPALAREHALLGVDVVALPSSDWRGIDPIHTQMAALRAIEGGYSVLRSTRMGLSAGIDAHGRLRGWLSANESGERLLVVTLPASRRATIYATIGDALVFAGLAWVLTLATSVVLRRSATAVAPVGGR